MDKKFIKQQFNKQAEHFARFGLTQNEDIFKFTFDFCKFVPDDILLDVACGSGAFVNFCANHLKASFGVDLSDELISYAKKYVGPFSKSPIFLCGDVEHLPFPESSFTVATCRSALHHMENPNRVIQEMVRASKKAGKICLQDMTTYDEPRINEFFEEMEKLVDPSHHRTLTTDEIKQLLVEQNVNIVNVFETTLTHNLHEYFGHAFQTERQIDLLAELISTGLSDPALSDFLFEKEKTLFFKRSGLVIYGEAPPE